MAIGPDLVRPARGTRPANRRQLIIKAATDLFYRKGYAGVGMGDVAEAVAIGPSALYRHFRGKQDLLATVVADALQKVDDAITAAPNSGIETALATATLEHRWVGVLWRREARHLSENDQAAFRLAARSIGARLTEVVRARRPDIGDDEADLLAWSALAIANSVSFHSVSLPETEFAQLLGTMISAVIEVRLPIQGLGRSATTGAGSLTVRSRRETILTEAVRLFAEQGFSAVSMEDIGAAVGIAGPSLYNHFPSKADILSVAIFRGDEWLRFDMTRAFAQASDPSGGLARLLHSYWSFVFVNPYLMQTLVSETVHLPDEARHRARAAQRTYITEWVHLLQQVHPDDDPRSARIRVQAAQSMMNDLALTLHLRRFPGLDDAVTAIGTALLEIPTG